MTRRPIALTTAAVLLTEAVGVVLLHSVLAAVLENQRMSLAGLDPDAMIAGTWAMGGAFGVYLAVCGGVLVRVGARDVPPGRWTRVLLITCAITHGVLGAVVVGLVGWGAFAVLMVVLGLVVLSLIAYGPGAAEDGQGPEDGLGPEFGHRDAQLGQETAQQGQ
ncbi:hypothetical protein [Streptomyces sp. TRM49041]|uniref:hypothetical protein n=1 Tax=Streptomyces sp. TRM49041 TaxID=2603216 RepID=UPI0021CD00E3|nr:hypothetical protein [Streptomyces sp. TRM49041]